MRIKGITELVARPFVVTASRKLATGRLLVQSARIVAGSDTATLKVYDGVDANGELLIPLSAGATYSDSDQALIGDLCEHGCYVALTGTGAVATVRLLPLPADVEIDNE